MAEVVWSNSALSDLTSIAEYIEDDSPKYAQITVGKIYERTGILESHPQLGRIVPEKEVETIRELIEGNYRIIYEIVDTTVYILTIHHSSRRLSI